MYLLNLHSREVRKLVKMPKLVHNEYIKVMKKLSTKIIFVLIALFVIGLIGLSKFAQNTIEKDMVKLARKLSRGGKVSVGIRTRILFWFYGSMQKAGWGASPAEKQYWLENGWLSGGRPWKENRGKEY